MRSIKGMFYYKVSLYTSAWAETPTRFLILGINPTSIKRVIKNAYPHSSKVSVVAVDAFAIGAVE